jgi:hypothetical protein
VIFSCPWCGWESDDLPKRDAESQWAAHACVSPPPAPKPGEPWEEYKIRCDATKEEMKREHEAPEPKRVNALSAGWKCETRTTKSGRRYKTYTSPSGEKFRSLKAARRSAGLEK